MQPHDVGEHEIVGRTGYSQVEIRIQLCLVRRLSFSVRSLGRLLLFDEGLADCHHVLGRRSLRGDFHDLRFDDFPGQTE